MEKVCQCNTYWSFKSTFMWSVSLLQVVWLSYMSGFLVGSILRNKATCINQLRLEKFHAWRMLCEITPPLCDLGFERNCTTKSPEMLTSTVLVCFWMHFSICDLFCSQRMLLLSIVILNSSVTLYWVLANMCISVFFTEIQGK